jgi:hypothetical protein
MASTKKLTLDNPSVGASLQEQMAQALASGNTTELERLIGLKAQAEAFVNKGNTATIGEVIESKTTSKAAKSYKDVVRFAHNTIHHYAKVDAKGKGCMSWDFNPIMKQFLSIDNETLFALTRKMEENGDLYRLPGRAKNGKGYVVFYVPGEQPERKAKNLSIDIAAILAMK